MTSRLRAMRSECGAVAVEFALVVPLMVMLLLGIVTAGASYNTALGTTDAVREGARFGATTLTSPAPVGFGNWSAAVQQKTADLSAGAIASASQVCVKLLKGTSTVVQQSACTFASSEPPNPAGVAATDCVVKVWARVPVKINIGIKVWTIDVIRVAVARYERACA